MKTITCDKCGKEVGTFYRSVSAEKFVIDIGLTADLVYRKYPEYDLCEQCNAEFNTYISTKIREFFQPEETKDNTCETCKYYENDDGLFPCGGCITLSQKSDGAIVKTQWENKDE